MGLAAQLDVTRLLHEWSEGDDEARERLWRLVFPELKRLAHHCLKQERPGHTLETHAVINELYMRLIDWKSAHWYRDPGLEFRPRVVTLGDEAKIR